MKVLDEAGKGVEPGATLPVGDLGLPVKGGGPTLLVFWKRL